MHARWVRVRVRVCLYELFVSVCAVSRLPRDPPDARRRMTLIIRDNVLNTVEPSPFATHPPPCPPMNTLIHISIEAVAAAGTSTDGGRVS